jgi:hypothetical protein
MALEPFANPVHDTTTPLTGPLSSVTLATMESVVESSVQGAPVFWIWASVLLD